MGKEAPPRDSKRILLPLVTLVYLLAELSFNARLLDVAGSVSTESEVAGLEFWGKSLSGIACALLIARWTERRLRLSAANSLLLALPVIPIVFAAQGALIDHLVDNSSNRQRQIAAYVSWLPATVVKRYANVADLNLPSGRLSAPEGKIFFALFPALAYLSPGVVNSIDRQLEVLLKSKVERELGFRDGFYNDTYRVAVNRIKDAYNKKYVPASNEFSELADGKWSEYRARLAKGGIDPYIATESTRRQVVQRLQKNGINVPDNFQLNDRPTFEAAVTAESGSGAARFSTEVSKEMGFDTTLPPGLTWQAFASHPDIQNKLKTELGLGSVGSVRSVDLDWTPAEVEKNLYRPIVASSVSRAATQFRAGEASYAHGGVNGNRGEKAVRAVLVPPIALSFSLFFGVFNLVALLITPLINMLDHVGLKERTKFCAGFVMRGLLLAGILIGPMQLRNDVSESKAFQSMLTVADYQGFKPVGLYMTWLVKAEPVVYPIASAVRDWAFLGVRFEKRPHILEGRPFGLEILKKLPGVPKLLSASSV